MKTKNTLLGTSPNLESMVKLISEYSCGACLSLKQLDANTLQGSNTRGSLSSVIVKKGKRYRFEYIN